MDWQRSMLGMHGMSKITEPEDGEVEGVEDNEEDFYGSNGQEEEDNTQAGAAEGGAGDLLNSTLPAKVESAAQPMQSFQSQPIPRSALTPEEKKAENQRKAEMLRAQLLAKRQSTPAKQTPKASTPNPDSAPALQSAKSPVLQGVPPQKRTSAIPTIGQAQLTAAASNDSLGLDSLIAEGRTAAEAKSKEQTGIQTHGEILNGTVSSSSISKPAATPARADGPKQEHRIEPVAEANSVTAEKNRPSQLTDAYYADLPAWLEITGYHDVEYRASKLRTYKARKELEQEKARIEAEIARLNREEEEERIAIRSSVAPSTPATNVPSFPSTMPTDDQAALHATASRVMNGSSLKRAHSPTPREKVSRRREDLAPLSSTNGFRIRGANDHSPTSTASRAPLERRVSYSPERNRDPSLERRQSYYRGRNGVHYDQYTPPSRPYGGTRGPPAPYSGIRHPSGSTLREYTNGRPPILQYGDGLGGGNGASRQ